MAFEQVIKNLDNCLRTDKGCTSELDYVEQTSWILFLKYLDDLEKSKKLACELQVRYIFLCNFVIVMRQ